MKTYKLDTSKWDRGRNSAETKLDGYAGRCCLGFVAREEAIPITAQDSPKGCELSGVGVETWCRLGLLEPEEQVIGVVLKHSPLASALMSQNDACDGASDETRVRSLNDCLSYYGADWRFELA